MKKKEEEEQEEEEEEGNVYGYKMRKFNFFSLERFSRMEKIDASSMSRVMWPRFSPGKIICIAQRQVWETFQRRCR